MKRFRYVASFLSAIFLIALSLSGTSLNCGRNHSGDYPIQPVPFTQVRMTDNFWRARMEINRSVTIPHAFRKNQETGRIANFALAAGMTQGEQQGLYPFDDTDLYKTIEGASYSLMLDPDPAMETYIDSLIAIIQAAQEEDGYLYTARTNHAERLKSWFGDKRWDKLESSHELYDAGHLFEAAVAHYQATGKKSLLNVALKYADLIERTFGPEKLQKPPGHQVIEMGLAKLYRITGDSRYIKLAKYMLDIRGKALDGRELRGSYNQDHMPVVEQKEAVGHAVRAAYMFAGMADIAALTGDASYIRSIDRLWEDVVGRKLYVTGGIGATGNIEGFGKPYDLPNMRAYNETCASIANIFWNHRLFLLHGEAKYLDVLERTLYNALLSGISLDGNHFFYPNPLQSVGQHARSEWFRCACCPGNVTRFIASVPGYAYAMKDDQVFVNLYASNEASIVINDKPLRIVQETEYPWNGKVRVTLYPEQGDLQLTLALRIPGWALGRPVPSDLYRYLNNEEADITLRINGKTEPLNIENGFALVSRVWQNEDNVELELPMLIRRTVAHDSVEADVGRVALERGPIVFCAEWPDQEGGHVTNLLLHHDQKLESEFLPDLLRGIPVIRAQAVGYRMDDENNLIHEDQALMAIPYYAWAHRGKGEMTVWLASQEDAVRPVRNPTLASNSRVEASYGRNPGAVNDQLEPENSIDHDVPYLHWWPHKGTTEWVQYDFGRTEKVSGVEVYWFDDTGMGECRLPSAWRVLYLRGGEWLPVKNPGTYEISKDRFNTVRFQPVRTNALRLEVTSQDGWAGGIHEWKLK